MTAGTMERLLLELKAAAEPTRIRVLVLCSRSELSVSDLTQILGQSQPRVSRHLKLLCDAGLLARFREGTYAFFRLAETGLGAKVARALVDLVPADDPTLALDMERLDAIKRSRAASAANYFSRNAPLWDQIRALHIADSEVEDVLRDLMPPGPVGTLLDIGTGTGRIIEVLGDRAERAIGIDLSREMLAVARANLERAGFKSAQVRQGDLYQLPVPRASVDVAVMHQVLHYMEDPLDAIAEAGRVLKPGGLLLIADFEQHTVESLREEHAHRWLGFDEQVVAGWLTDAGFSAPDVHRLPGTPLTVTIWAAQRQPATARPINNATVEYAGELKYE
ncbi:metalloregulator ArsR/SmtB family transcription factor [Fodinicurvata sp. EGI_FJ10296]|uniref:ArsR/SmtB family transcription factor n=1 Tax=Fodinicurvata sp. EGI_FJ10296 TaxID=3231908 RepID=UPI00345420E3